MGDISPARVKRLAKEFFWVGAGQIMAVIGGLVGIRLLTDALSPARFGELALGMTVATLTQQVVLGPAAGAILRFFAPANEAKQLGAYLKSSRRLLVQGTVLLFVMAVLSGLALGVLGRTHWLALLLGAFLFSLLSGYCSALDGMQNAARQRAVVAWHQGMGQWLRFSLALALIAALGALSSAAMLGYAIASALVLGSQIILFRRKILAMLPAQRAASEVDAVYWTEQMRVYAWPFAAWGIFTWAQMASDRWSLQARGSTIEVGLYAALYQLGYYPMTLLSSFLVQLISPVLFSRAGDGSDPERMAQSHRLNRLLLFGSIGLVSAGAIFALLFHREIFSLLAAPGYRQVSPLLPVMVLSGGLFATGQIAVLSLLSGVNSQLLMAPKIVTSLLGVLLNFAGAFWLGISGVVFAGATVSSIYLVWILMLGRRQRTGPVNRSVSG
jgi:O-antigen/teichoic acid export membrane protein